MAIVRDSKIAQTRNGFGYLREIVARGAVIELFQFARQKDGKDSSCRYPRLVIGDRSFDIIHTGSMDTWNDVSKLYRLLSRKQKLTLPGNNILPSTYTSVEECSSRHIAWHNPLHLVFPHQ